MAEPKWASAFALAPSVLKEIIIQSGLSDSFQAKLDGVDWSQPDSIMLAGFSIRSQLQKIELPLEIEAEVGYAYSNLCARSEASEPFVIVQNIEQSLHQGRTHIGLQSIIKAIKSAYSEYLTSAIISKNIVSLEQAFDGTPTLTITETHSWYASGIITTSDSRNSNYLLIASTWGIAEDIARKELARDEYLFHKPTLAKGFASLIQCHPGHKEFRLDFDTKTYRLSLNEVPYTSIRELSLTRAQALKLALAGLAAEAHHQKPLQIDWGALSKADTELLLLGMQDGVKAKPKPYKIFKLVQHGQALSQGKAVGTGLAVGRLRLVSTREEASTLEEGEILVTEKTEPDWEPYFRKAAAIITEKDTRVSHSTILARELGIPAILNANIDRLRLLNGKRATVACCRGTTAYVYEGESVFETEVYDAKHLPLLKPSLMVNLSMPERALREALLPWAGAGLVRSEFLFTGWIRIHPMALLHPERLTSEVQATIARLCRGYASRRDYFIDKLSQGVSLIASAFWPRPVLLRLSDLKSKEYKKLVGGERFEPQESNQAMGFRGAARYCDQEYQPAFSMELEALAQVRARLGMKNLHICIPFCRTPEEAEEVIEKLSEAGLKRGEDGLEVWMMAELPSNVILADEFASLFDGFSIGSNDLTALTMGIDRDNPKVSARFDEMHPAMMDSYQRLVDAAHKANRLVSFCGQIASEDSLFCEALAEIGVDSISVTPDAFAATLAALRKG